MRHSKILFAISVLSIALVALIFTKPKSNGLHYMVDRMHSLIQPFPETYQMCHLSDVVSEASQDAKYRLEIRIVSLPYCKGKCEVPPISGYLNDWQFLKLMDEVQGNIACSTLMWPKLEITEGPNNFSIANYQIALTKHNDRLFLKYSWGNGFTYSHEFDVPEGMTFVCSCGEHGMANVAEPPLYPDWLSRFQPYSMYQSECLLLVKYQEIEPAAVK
jgi:hypothetical protein